MRILFLTGRELSYPRNAVLHRAFEQFAHVESIAPERPPRSLVASSLSVAARALPHLLPTPDLIFVGFYGHLILRTLAPLIRAPLLFDAFVSTYDTLCFDRRVFAPDSARGRLAYRLDRSTVRRADHVLLDTPQHVAYFVRTFDTPASRFSALPVGCQDAIFHPQRRTESSGACMRVLYYSTYLPLHGVETIIRAAAQLAHAPIHFRLIGQGPLRGESQALAQSLGLNNVEFVDSVPLEALVGEIAGADICLGGHFGNSAKAERVVPGKIYQMLAMERPVIAANTPANRELLCHGKHALLVPPFDAAALAGAIRTLYAQPALREQIAAAGRARYVSHASERVITERLHAIVKKMMQGNHANK